MNAAAALTLALAVSTTPSPSSLASGDSQLATPSPPAPDTLIPGVTVWVYDLGDKVERRPTIAEGQTPNYYAVSPGIAFDQPFKAPAGPPLATNFAGEIRGWLNITEPGRYLFLLRCDDGAELRLDGAPIADTAGQPNFTAEGDIELKPGLHPLSIPFYQREGKFDLKLTWRRTATEPWVRVPESALRTEAGQTFATSPGPKRWFYGIDPNRPGDGRPLDSVHPSMKLENFRGPSYQPAVGALAFLPDGRLAVATWDKLGAIDILSGLDHSEAPGGGEVKVARFAQGLGEPLGLAVVDGDLLVTQKREITRLRDLDGDGKADRYEVVAADWPASHNYHEFSFNLVPLDRSLYITTSVPLRSGSTNYTPGSTPAFAVSGGPGCAFRIDPRTGRWEIFARGLRAPNGMGLGFEGGLYCCDNQGGWLPASRLNLIRKGGFYGHQTEPDGAVPSDNPVAWFPQGEIGNSPSEPVLLPDGPYRGQMLVGDVTYGGLQRVFVENVGGGVQGTVFRFSQGLEAGVNRLAWGPDHCLYVGGIGSNGNWNHKDKKFGLQRLRPTGVIPFEMHRVQARADGLLITFTKPVPAAALASPASYLVRSWRYQPTVDYGGPKIDQRTHAVAEVVTSPDRTRAFLRLPDLQPGRVAYIRLRNLKDDSGAEPFTTEAWSTLNTLGDVPGPAFDHPFALDPARLVSPAPPPPPAAMILFDGSSLDRWRQGPPTTLTPPPHPAEGGPARWTIDHGHLLVDKTLGDIVTSESFGDCLLHVEWLSPPGGEASAQTNGNSGVKLQSRYEIQVLNTPGFPHPPLFNEPGSIYRQKPADINASLGAGVWQSYDIRFRAPRWNGRTKTENARISLWWNGVLVQDNVEVRGKTGMSAEEAPGEHPILLQAHPSGAVGPVRYRNIWVIRQ